MEQLQEELGSERFAYVDFHIRGSLGSDVGDEREAYYRVRGTPTVLFDGKNRRVGGSNHASIYQTSLDNTEPESKINVEATASLDLATGLISVDVRVEIGETIDFPDECVVHAVLAEDLTAPRLEKKVARVRALTAPLEVDEEGETRSFSVLVDPADHWQTQNMHVIAWVQRDSESAERDSKILNAVQTAFGQATPIEQTSWGQLKATFR